MTFIYVLKSIFIFWNWTPNDSETYYIVSIGTSVCWS